MTKLKNYIFKSWPFWIAWIITSELVGLWYAILFSLMWMLVQAYEEEYTRRHPKIKYNRMQRPKKDYVWMVQDGVEWDIDNNLPMYTSDYLRRNL